MIHRAVSAKPIPHRKRHAEEPLSAHAPVTVEAIDPVLVPGAHVRGEPAQRLTPLEEPGPVFRRLQEPLPARNDFERAIALAREMLQCSPPALVHTIANARLALDQDEPAAVAAIPEMAATVQATADFQEGIASFIERRPAQFTGR